MSPYEDLLLDALLENGFTLEESLRLVALEERTEREYHQWWEDLAQVLGIGRRQERVN